MKTKYDKQNKKNENEAIRTAYDDLEESYIGKIYRLLSEQCFIRKGNAVFIQGISVEKNCNKGNDREYYLQCYDLSKMETDTICLESSNLNKLKSISVDDLKPLERQNLEALCETFTKIKEKK